MDKITHGSWVAECAGNTGGETPVDVYEVNTARTRVCEYVSEADAYLISAAPDLLSVVKKFLDAVHMTDRVELRSLISPAEYAIAKAEGK